MNGSIWVVATVLDFKPVICGVFVSEEEAKDELKVHLKNEWDAVYWSDPAPPPFPEDLNVAHTALVEYHEAKYSTSNNLGDAERWGEYTLTKHVIDGFAMMCRSASE